VKEGRYATWAGSECVGGIYVYEGQCIMHVFYIDTIPGFFLFIIEYINSCPSISVLAFLGAVEEALMSSTTV
jgi:hypothetical protein